MSDKVEVKDSYLKHFTENLSKKIKNNISDVNITGRDEETRQTILSLMLKGKSNPLLIGEAGVGKTAIVEAVAKKILLNEVPEQLQNKEILSLEMSSLKNNIDGEELESKFKKILDELKLNNGKYILFIDETHTLFNAGDAGNVIKPPMARGEIQLIGATTIKEYHSTIEADKALERRFQIINVDEPNAETAYHILDNIKGKYQRHYNVAYSDKTLMECVNLSVQYLPSRKLPDKAIDVMDQVGALCSYKNESIVKTNMVYEVITNLTGVPIGKITKSDEQLPYYLPKKLKERVKGQDEAIDSVSDAIIMNKANLTDPKRPIASYIFLGTTGVGKTELAKALTEQLFGNEDKYIRFNMSEFKTKEDIKDLRISLTEEIKHKPFAVVLFDEMEKAEKSVMDLYLQILDDGVLTDEYGNEASFRNCVIIFTTNIGSQFIKDSQRYNETYDTEHTKRVLNQQIDDELQNYFRPELVNRIDRKIMFNMLNKNIALEIVKKGIDKEIKRIEYQYPNVKIKVHEKDSNHVDDLYSYIQRIGYDKDLGARPIKRTIVDSFRSPISAQLLKYSRENDNLVLEVAVVGNPPTNKTLRSTQKLKFTAYTMQ